MNGNFNEALAMLAGREPIVPASPLETWPRADFTGLDMLIAGARREMGEARWQELNAEWETPAEAWDRAKDIAARHPINGEAA